MAKDPTYIKLINTYRWRQLRNSILKQHPLCERCESEGVIRAACCVHHRQPVESAQTNSEKERLMFAPDNLMALCQSCHQQIHIELLSRSRKTARERATKAKALIIKHFFG